MPFDPDRGTGRTTRMLLRAVLAAMEKKQTIYVVAFQHQHAMWMRRRVGDMLYALSHDMVRTLGSGALELVNGSVIRFVSDEAARSLEFGSPPGSLFYDHHMPRPFRPPPSPVPGKLPEGGG